MQMPKRCRHPVGRGRPEGNAIYEPRLLQRIYHSALVPSDGNGRGPAGGGW